MSSHGALGRLFLCHGAGGDRESLAPLAHAIERAGCGPATPLSYPGRDGAPGPARESVGELAAATRDHVRRALGSLDEPHVILGHSMGGAVAIEYALDAPAGLRALVLVSTGARLRVQPQILQAFAAESEILTAADGTTAPADDATLFARSLVLTARAPRSSALADWRAANAFDRMDRVHELRTPTLVLVGEDDNLTPPKYARFLHERIPGAQRVTLPGAGHSLPTEHAERVAALTAAFLERLATLDGAGQS